MPINKRKNENKDEFISRCMSIEIGNGKEQEQAYAICNYKWEEDLKKEIPFEQLYIDEKHDGVFAVSFVSEPAIEENLIFMEIQKPKNEKREIYSPALIPNKPIYRYDEKTGIEKNIIFSKEIVEKCRKNYMMKYFNKTTYQHEYEIEGAKIIESWIVLDKNNDKINKLGYNVEEGTWCLGFYIEDDKLWKNIKNGEIKGLSIEGYFTSKYENLSSDIDNFLLNKIYEIDKLNISDEEKLIKLKKYFNL